MFCNQQVMKYFICSQIKILKMNHKHKNIYITCPHRCNYDAIHNFFAKLKKKPKSIKVYWNGCRDVSVVYYNDEKNTSNITPSWYHLLKDDFYTFSRQGVPQAHSKGILNFLFDLFVSLFRLLANYTKFYILLFCVNRTNIC